MGRKRELREEREKRNEELRQMGIQAPTEEDDGLYDFLNGGLLDQFIEAGGTTTNSFLRMLTMMRSCRNSSTLVAPVRAWRIMRMRETTMKWTWTQYFQLPRRQSLRISKQE